MKLKIFSNFLIAFLCLIALEQVTCDTDLKKEFGEKLGAFIKVSGIELFQTAIKTTQDFYAKLLNEASPNPEQIALINEKNIDLNELSNKIESAINDPPRFIQMVNDFINTKYINALEFEKNELGLYDEKKWPTILKFTMESLTKMDEASKKFAMSVYYKWTELYEELPKEEIDKHAEYKEINELMQGVAKTKGRGSVFLEVVKSLITFFDCDDWKIILNVGKNN